LTACKSSFRVLHEIVQRVEDLRLDHNRLAAAPQLTVRDIGDQSSNLSRMRFQARAEGPGPALRFS
jgi:hypothetical protein